MRLNFNTVVTSYFHTYPGDFSPTRAELEGWDALLLKRYGPFAATTMAHYGLNVQDPLQLNWIITLAELAADMTAAAKIDRACHFYAVLAAGGVAPLIRFTSRAGSSLRDVMRLQSARGPHTAKAARKPRRGTRPKSSK